MHHNIHIPQLLLTPARPGPARHVFFPLLAKVLFLSHEKEVLGGADKACIYVAYPFNHFVRSL